MKYFVISLIAISVYRMVQMRIEQFGRPEPKKRVSWESKQLGMTSSYVFWLVAVQLGKSGSCKQYSQSTGK